MSMEYSEITHHCDEDDKQVQPHGAICKPAVVPQGPHLTNEEANSNEDDAAHRIAQFEFGDL